MTQIEQTKAMQGSNKAVELFKEKYGDFNADIIEFYPVGTDKFFIACHFRSDAKLQKYYVMLWGMARITKEPRPIWVYKKHSVASTPFDTIEEARDFVEKLING